MYSMRKSRILKKYLDKNSIASNRNQRTMNPEDMGMTVRLRQTCKDMNVLITEVITMIHIIGRLGNQDLVHIANNLEIIVRSLIKQRDLGWKIKCTFAIVKPNEEERDSIEQFLSDVKTRMHYLDITAIPANLDMTPIKEYLDIRQIQIFQEDLYSWFGTASWMATMNKEKSTDEIDRYVDHILSTVQGAGEMDDYESRLAEYTMRMEEQNRQTKLEKDLRAQQEAHKASQEGMKGFRHLFNYAVASLEGDSRIKMGQATIRDRINAYGRNWFFVLCCYSYRGESIYRYLGKDNQIVQTFAKAFAFDNKAKADEAMSKIAVEHPQRAFEVVDLFPVEL